jgi:hypothetical protein
MWKYMQHPDKLLQHTYTTIATCATRGEFSLCYRGHPTPMTLAKLVENYSSSQLINDADPTV